MANAQTYCNTPEFTSLESWATDLREGVKNEGLPAIDTACPTEGSRQKVLVIGIDGFRADAAAMLPLPNLRRLERIGSYSYWAHLQDTGSAVSGPGWASLMTGVEPAKHKVDGNGDVTDIDPQYPTFLKAVKDSFPEKKVAAAATWDEIIEMIEHQDATTLDGSLKAADDAEMVSKSLEFIESGTYDLIFAAFDSVDSAGHSQVREVNVCLFSGVEISPLVFSFLISVQLKGFDGYLSSYIEAVKATDFRVGLLLDAITARSEGEEWLIVLTTDHGGKEYSHVRYRFHFSLLMQVSLLLFTNKNCSSFNHCFTLETQGPYDYYNRRIPFMVASNSPRVQIGRAPIDHPGSHMDILPTVMHFFGGADAVPEGLDGQVFGFRDYELPPPAGECAGSNPATCGCEEAKQADYRGTIATTISGRTCQRWDSQFPHDHSNSPSDRPLSGLEENYCRNPDGEDTAWCYTTDPDKRWEACDVPTCTIDGTPTSAPVSAPTPASGCSDCDGTCIELSVMTDSNPNELRLKLRNENTKEWLLVVGKKDYTEPNTLYTENICQPESCFKLMMTDKGKDGFDSGGYYSLVVDGETLIDERADYGKKEITKFGSC